MFNTNINKKRKYECLDNNVTPLEFKDFNMKTDDIVQYVEEIFDKYFVDIKNRLEINHKNLVNICYKNSDKFSDDLKRLFEKFNYHFETIVTRNTDMNIEECKERFDLLNYTPIIELDSDIISFTNTSRNFWDFVEILILKTFQFEGQCIYTLNRDIGKMCDISEDTIEERINVDLKFFLRKYQDLPPRIIKNLKTRYFNIPINDDFYVPDTPTQEKPKSFDSLIEDE